MYMVWTYFRFHNIYTLPFAKLSQYLTDIPFFIMIEDHSTILRGEYYVILAIPFGMT